MWILAICFIVHSILLISVFEIYFQSPIIDGIVPIENDGNILAKRVVLLVGDGVRAQSFFEVRNGSVAAPFLRDVIKHRGRWGISHTRVPTESRPGHVAIIAGVYEDPSAIFKGWKDNPIEFDTVFNRSVLTFGWGSPDILLMFNKGNAKERVIVDTYSSYSEVFFNSAVERSIWSLDRLKDFLKTAKLNSTLNEKIIQEKIIFFLHLLGPDTSGHSDKPASNEYFENIRVTDEIAKQVQSLFDEYYGDNATAYIYTSDHGMTDWGSHGDGSSHETETPFIAWGAGILHPQIKNESSPEQRLWGLDGLRRNDINQVDISALIAILLGISIPVHSTGTLPLDILNMTDKNKSSSLFLNARQMHARYRRKRQLVEENTISWLYSPVNEFSLNEENKKIDVLASHFKHFNYSEQLRISEKLISDSKAGILYYENYYQDILLTCTVCSYVGWICWLILNIIPKGCSRKENGKFSFRIIRLTMNVVMISSTCLIVLLIKLQSLPYQYYLYCCLPLVIWWDVLRKFFPWYYSLNFKIPVPEICVHTIVYGCAVELMVLVFYDRSVLRILIILFAICQTKPLFSFIRIPRIQIIWIISCFVQCIFPFLPILGKKPDTLFLFLAAFVWTILYGLAYFSFKKYNQPKSMMNSLMVSFVIQILTLFNVYLVTCSYLLKEGLPLGCQIFSWSVFVLSPMLPLFSRMQIVPRITLIFGSLGIMCSLFSVAEDTMFFPFFVFHLMIWFLNEYKINDGLVWRADFQNCCNQKYDVDKYKAHNLTFDDLKKGFLFFFYILYSFFATGNIASVNSFDPSSIRSFLAVFSPFTMLILMLIKIIIPFVAVTCIFRASNVISRAPAWKMFLMILIFCSVMGLNFLFGVQNVGSWLEIGSSVSRYVIAQVTTLFLVLIYFFSYFLTNTKLDFPNLIRHIKNMSY